ncbi:MAG: AraC family transcriptional regulator [Flavobacteriaceae bacterium]
MTQIKNLKIKNMVCDRCIMVVKDVFDRNKIPVSEVILGEATLAEPITENQKEILDQKLKAVGFEIIETRKSQIAEKIKNEIITLVFDPKGIRLTENLSDYLSDKIGLEYSYLTSVFSEEENLSIEKYFILQKIERIKELISYDELLLKEIADRMQYSSVAHLSSQFKKITGMSPTQYKQNQNRLPINKL